MSKQLERWTPNPKIPGSLPLGCSKADSAFPPSGVNQPEDLRVKSVSITLRQLTPIHKKGYSTKKHALLK